jgi:hypothetical protein
VKKGAAQTMRENYYLIDTDLKVQRLASHLSRKGTWWDTDLLDETLDKGQLVGHEDGPPLPITPDGNLQPGVLYESSTDPNVRFYLPEYKLNLVNGLYTTRLQWRDKEADPNGPLAFLTLDIVAVVPSSPNFTLQEIPHTPVARIVYQLPVENGGVTSDLRPVLSVEVGALNPIGNGVRQVILPISEKPTFDRLYQIMTDANFNAHLEIRCFAVAGRKTFRHIVVDTFDAALQAEILQKKKILYTDLISQKKENITENTSPTAVNVRKVTLENSPAQRIGWQDAIQVAQNADVSVFAATLRSNDTNNMATQLIKNRVVSMKQLRLDQVNWVDISNLNTSFDGSSANIGTLSNQLLPEFSSSPVTELRRIPTDTGVATTADHLESSGGTPTSPSRVPARRRVWRNTLQEVIVEPILSRAYAPSLDQAWSASDILTSVHAANVKAVPVRAYLDEDGKPALMKIPVETLQLIDPFCFVSATNAYMFDFPDEMHPGDHHVLIAMEVFDGVNKVGVIYQDSAYVDQVYYQPEEFRLPRLDIDPYLPDLQILFHELITQDQDNSTTANDSNDGNTDITTAADINYKVTLVYRAVPYVNPLLLTLAQQQLFNENPVLEKIHFRALAPQTTILKLRVPEDENEGLLADVQRPDVEVRFDQGMVDQVELSRTEFERIFTSFQSSAGVGIEGEIEAHLSDNQETHISVMLSLKETTGSVFHMVYMGPDTDGRHRVHLTNRIESPVVLEDIYTVTLGRSIIARPQDAPGGTIQPGEEFDLFYKIEPPTASVLDLSPSLAVSIQVDPVRLWPKLFVNKGYRSETFKVTPTAQAEYFGVIPPSSSEPLTGLQVTFDDETKITLTIQRLQADVDLQIPLLPYLLGDPHARKYRYHVTNLLGDDAHPDISSDWISGEGEGSLTIIPAGA